MKPVAQPGFTTSVTSSSSVVFERFPYRYIESGTLENGKPDFRIQKMGHYSPRYKDMYLCDNSMQFVQAIEDFEYTKWLDPDGVPCYVKGDDDE